MRLVERFYAFMGHPWPPPLHGDPPTLGGWSLTADCPVWAGGPLPGWVVWLPRLWARSTESVGRAKVGAGSGDEPRRSRRLLHKPIAAEAWASWSCLVAALAH